MKEDGNSKDERSIRALNLAKRKTTYGEIATNLEKRRKEFRRLNCRKTKKV
jgi:hypothetical protein